MPKFRVKLDDMNASHSLVTITLTADDKKQAGEKALVKQGKKDCPGGSDHAKETEVDDWDEVCCKICGCPVDQYVIESVTEIGSK